MDDRLFLHDGEQLLVSMRPSRGYLCIEFLKGILETLIIGLLLSVLVGLLVWIVTGQFLAAGGYTAVMLLTFFGVEIRRYRLWKQSSLRVTTERILLQHHASLFGNRLTTIKWPQYQESFLGPFLPLDLFFRTRSLCIRYGTADAQANVCFPSLPYARDMKHYLDKADSALRKNQTEILKPFVAKPRGRRDEEVGKRT